MPRVRKRDGSVSEYDEGKVAHEILLAAQASGEGDPSFAAELAEVVTFFLEKHHGTGNGDTTVEPEQIADMIERVLLETAPPGVAKAYILRRQRQEAADEDITVHRPHSYGQKALFPDDVLTVEAETRAEAFHWDKHRIVEALVRESDIAPKAAEQIATRVEERLFNSGLKRVTTGLIRELIDVELFNLGMTQHRDQQAVIGIPRFDLEAAILRGRERDDAPAFRDPSDLDRFVHNTVLRRYTLIDVHSPEVAEAHVDGRLHLHGLGDPLRLHSLRVCPEGIKHGWPTAGRSGAPMPPDPHDARRASDRIAAPGTEEQLFALLRRYAEELQELVTDRVTFTGFSLVLAPLVARLDADGRRAVLRRAFGALSGRVATRLRLEFPLEVPADLRDAPVVGLGGTVEEGMRLADLTPVIRELARDATLLLLEGKHQALLAPDITLAVDADSTTHAESLEVLELAADCASRHGSPRFRFLRPARMESSRVSHGADALARNAETAVVALSLNLPQAAFRSGRGNHDGFAVECDRLLQLAHAAVTERYQLLVGSLSRLAHPLLAVGRDGSTPLHPATIDLRNGFARLAIVGLHEAMSYLADDGRDAEGAGGSMFGDEAPTTGESTTRGGLRALSYLAFALREQEAQTPLSLRLADGRDGLVAERFRRIDARTRPEHLRALADRTPLAPAGYTPGISLPGAADAMACLTRESRFHTMLDRDAEIVVPARCPTHDARTVVEAIRHAVYRTTAHGMALPAMAVSCPACGDSRATPLAVPAVCPTCGYRTPEYGWLIGNRFVPAPGVSADDGDEDESEPATPGESGVPRDDS